MYRSITVVLLIISVISVNTQTFATSISDGLQDEDQLQKCIDRVDPVNPSPLTRTDRLMIVTDCIQQMQNSH